MCNVCCRTWEGTRALVLTHVGLGPKHLDRVKAALEGSAASPIQQLDLSSEQCAGLWWSQNKLPSTALFASQHACSCPFMLHSADTSTRHDVRRPDKVSYHMICLCLCAQPCCIQTQATC